MPPKKTRGTTDVDLYADRFHHIIQVWMQGNSFVKNAFTMEGIFNYSAIVRCLENPDAINALKNRNPDDPDRDLEISVEIAERLRCCLSYINHLQMKFGSVSEDGLVDISEKSYYAFDVFYVSRTPFVTYRDDLASEAKQKRELIAAQIQAAHDAAAASAVTAAAAQAQLDALTLSATSSGTSSGTAPVTSPGTGNANPGSNPGATQPSANPAHLALAILQRGVKLDESNFPQLKTDAGWFDFHRKFDMHCDLHGFANVLDESFVPAAAPVTNDEISLLIRDENFTAATDYGVSRLFSELSTFGDLITGVVAAAHEQRERPVDFESFRRFFLNAPREVVQHTFNATTQHYRNLPATWRIMDTRRSHYPAGNKLSRHEGVGTDTIFLDVDSWGRVKCVQFYIGRNSYYMSVHGMYTDGEFVNSLEDEIRFRGAMDTLISDRAQAEISNRVKTILRALYIREWQSEPTKQHQHTTERFIQEAKKYANWIRNTSGAPPEAMFHILKYVCFVWNRTARKLLGWRTPCEALTGQTPDVSMLLTFRFWQGCYIKNYQEPGTGFPSQSNEIFVNFLGFA